MAALNNKHPPWFSITPDSEGVNCSDPYEIFYNDIEKNEAEKYVSMLKEHSYKTLTSPVTVEPWRFIPSTYVVCEEDKAIPLEGQLGLIKGAQAIAEGSKFELFLFKNSDSFYYDEQSLYILVSLREDMA